ncbi:MAG: hypothetical protein ACREJ4_04945 [Candidatus Methylomirabilaceae bacterium]
MQVFRRTLRRLRTVRSSIAGGFRGVVTILTFTDSGWMRQFRLSKRIVALSCLLLIILAFGSTLSLVRLVRGEYYLTRMRYLEQQNSVMTSLLEGQAEQLSKLKLEMARLKEFEESLRQVSGLSERPGAPDAEPRTGEGPSVRRLRRP